MKLLAAFERLMFSMVLGIIYVLLMGFYKFLEPNQRLSLKNVSEFRGGSVDPNES